MQSLKILFQEHNRLILSRVDLLDYIGKKKLRFDPPISPDRVAQVSVDLLLGRKFTTFVNLQNTFQRLMLLRVTTPLKEQELYGHGAHDAFQHQDSPIPHKEHKK